MGLDSMCTLDYITDWPALAKQANYDAAKLARICDRSLSALRRFTLSRFGRRLEDWLINLALCEAARRIGTTNAPIKVVRTETGFESDSHFTRRFTKLFGAPPTGFALIYRQGRSKLRRQFKGWLGSDFLVKRDLPPPIWEETQRALCTRLSPATPPAVGTARKLENPPEPCAPVALFPPTQRPPGPPLPNLPAWRPIHPRPIIKPGPGPSPA